MDNNRYNIVRVLSQVFESEIKWVSFMRILLTGGGTGGHIYPALAIAGRIQSQYPDWQILYVGTAKGLEKTIVPENGLDFRTISVEGMPRKLGFAILKSGLKAVEGGVDALKILREFKPDVVVGTGGYVCGPVVLAARILGIPTIIHEQNALPGMTNKLLARVVDLVMVNFKQSEAYFTHPKKLVQTGLPVRQELFSINRAESLAYFGLSETPFTLLVCGGSRGARSINQAMVACYSTLLKTKEIQIIHLTGQTCYQETLDQLQKLGIDSAKNGHLVIRPYLNEMAYALVAADCCIGRAGATFLAEVRACGLPSILIPYPFASENHQQFNAQVLVDEGAATMILEDALTPEELQRQINRLIEDQDYRMKMAQCAKGADREDALTKIVKLVKTYAQRGK